MWANEVIIDFEIGFAEFEGREVVMPLFIVTEKPWNTHGFKVRPKGDNLSYYFLDIIRNFRGHVKPI